MQRNRYRTADRRPPTPARLHTLLALVATVLLAACGEVTGPDIRSTEFAATLGIDLDDFTEDPSGIFYRDDVVGEGPGIQVGSVARLRVEGWLTYGLLVQPELVLQDVEVGHGHVIEGIDYGMLGMREGGDRTIIVPPRLAHRDSNIMIFRLRIEEVVAAGPAPP